MSFREIASFEVLHGDRAWPWVAFDARAKAVAFVASAGTSGGTVETRRLAGEEAIAGPSFALPAGNGTMRRTGLTGYCGNAGVHTTRAPAAVTQPKSSMRCSLSWKRCEC